MTPGVLSIEVVAPSGHLWSGQAAQVSVPLVDGEMGILPGRQPILAVVGSGRVRVTPAAAGAGDGTEGAAGASAGGGARAGSGVTRQASGPAGAGGPAGAPSEAPSGPLTIRVTGGFCSVDHDTVTIAADEASLEGPGEGRAGGGAAAEASGEGLGEGRASRAGGGSPREGRA